MPGAELELVVYARGRAPAFEVNLNSGAHEPLHAGFDPAEEPSFWFVLDVTIARDVVVAAAHEALAWSLASAPTDDLVLNAVRTRRFLDDGVWSSMQSAAAWALDALLEAYAAAHAFPAR